MTSSMDVSMNSCEDDTSSSPPQQRFPFPFTPYSIQEDFMKNLYATIDQGKIGIFESPTGTGKSLSLICGALKWLTDYQQKEREAIEAIINGENKTQGSPLEGAINHEPLSPRKPLSQEIANEPMIGPWGERALLWRCGDGYIVGRDSREAEMDVKNAPSSSEPDWVLEFDSKRAQMEKNTLLIEEHKQIMKREEKLQQMRDEIKQKAIVKRKRFSPMDKSDMSQPVDENDNLHKPTDSEEDSLLVADYHSDDEMATSCDSGEEEDDAEPHVTKIFYCSRTHSQLSQFVHEVQKSPYGETTKVVTLGSRQNLCINETVKKLKSLSLINDRCLELQKKKKEKKEPKEEDPTKSKRKKTTASGCPFYTAGQMDTFKYRVALEVLDVEQLLSIGKELKACPYYGTRYTVPSAELVVLPYNTLLHSSTRKACGIRLDGNVVIIDEAHNLIETISNVYSVEVTGGQLCRAHSQLSQYMTKYRSRLKAKNLMYIKQILQVLTGWIRILGGKTDCPPDSQKTGPETSKLFTINDFLFATQIDNINLFKLQRYCEVSQISRKLNGFVEKYQGTVKTEADHAPKQSAMTRFLQELGQKSNKDTKQSTNPSDASERKEEEWQTFSSPLLHIEGFLLSLTNADKDGRVVIYKQDILGKSSIKFLLLNPAVHFTQVLKEARAVVVAGGTMQPVDEFKQQLLYCGGVSPDRIVEFSCGHVISPEQLLPIALAKGPSGIELDFTYQSRDQPKMMDEVGRVLANISNVVPGGVVCFFPSYDYEKRLHAHWESTGLIKRIETRKRIFREPRKAGQADFILGQFSSFIEKCSSGGAMASMNGAILMCVVGGKMSEGINFSDQLGRCVVMVGLPYANIKSPELKEKMDYLNATMPPINGKTAGQQHYDNICMKAVNQSIGRAIRHKDDYATILLLDQRYARPSVQSKLPAWIQTRMQTMPRFGPAFAMMSKFFALRRPGSTESQSCVTPCQ